MTRADLLLGAQIVKVAVVFEALRARFPSKTDALARIHISRNEFEPRVLAAMQDIKLDGLPKQLRRICTSRLGIGMILDEETRHSRDLLPVARGQELTSTLILWLESFRKAGPQHEGSDGLCARVVAISTSLTPERCLDVVTPHGSSETYAVHLPAQVRELIEMFPTKGSEDQGP